MRCVCIIVATLLLMSSQTAEGSAFSVQSVDSKLETDCLGTLQIDELLGRGRNALVFKAHMIANPAAVFAVKASEAADQLRKEAEVLFALNQTEGFPHYFCSGPGFIVMELLSGYKSLAAMHAAGQEPFVPMEDIAIALIDRLEAVHAAGYVHVDVHKRNIMVSAEGVALIDFGLAVRVSERKNPDYLNVFLSSVFEQTRQPLHPIDDIERLMYVLLHFGYGPLPWTSLMRMHETIDREQKPTKEVTAVILALEQGIFQLKTELLTYEGNEYFDKYNVPSGFRLILKYVADMRPVRESTSFSLDYNYLRSVLRADKEALLPVRQLREATDIPKPLGPSLLPVGSRV